MAMWAAIGTGLLLKGLIAAVFPVAAGLLYLGLDAAVAGGARRGGGCGRFAGMLLLLAIAAPWHVLATLRNPPYFDFTMHSEKGSYHGFFWFYFINEHVLRFLNLRYPRDYNTVPRAVLLAVPPAVAVSVERVFSGGAEAEVPAARTGRRARGCWRLCWAGFILAFFTFSTTQEYYSMPCYPALALLLGCAMASGHAWLKWGTRAIGVVTALALAAIAAILWMVRGTAGAGRYLGGADAESGCVHAVAGTHDGPDAARRSPICGCRWRWRGWRSLIGAVGAWRLRDGAASGGGAGGDDGAVLPCGAAGAGGVRSVHVVAAAGGGADWRRRRAS